MDHSRYDYYSCHWQTMLQCSHGDTIERHINSFFAFSDNNFSLTILKLSVNCLDDLWLSFHFFGISFCGNIYQYVFGSLALWIFHWSLSNRFVLYGQGENWTWHGSHGNDFVCVARGTNRLQEQYHKWFWTTERVSLRCNFFRINNAVQCLILLIHSTNCGIIKCITNSWVI